MGDEGWTFAPGDGVVADPINGASHLHKVYTAAVPDYSGRVSVPVLWDKETGTIVSNESSEIIRMFNGAFDEWGNADVDFYPAEAREEIDAVNDEVYNNLNNGVYKSGFADTQEAYEDAVTALFRTLDGLEARLGRHRYLTGNRITEADWRLFPTLVRFDPVYHGHFKCNLRRLRDHPNLWNLHARALPDPGRRRDGEPVPHQAALLRQPRIDQPDANRAARAGHRLFRPMIAAACGRSRRPAPRGAGQQRARNDTRGGR